MVLKFFYLFHSAFESGVFILYLPTLRLFYFIRFSLSLFRSRIFFSSHLSQYISVSILVISFRRRLPIFFFSPLIYSLHNWKSIVLQMQCSAGFTQKNLMQKSKRDTNTQSIRSFFVLFLGSTVQVDTQKQILVTLQMHKHTHTFIKNPKKTTPFNRNRIPFIGFLWFCRFLLPEMCSTLWNATKNQIYSMQAKIKNQTLNIRCEVLPLTYR